VHAHPDDETINNGATMAQCVDRGVHVTLVTCTLGEEGEVLVPELAHLAADQDDALGQQRINELATAMEALGVRDHRFLGGPGRFRDSGMMGLDSNDRPGCFWQADVDVAADLLVEVIREVRPQVVVTYDSNGGYGHPDHIQTHRVTMRAVELAQAEGIGPEKVNWGAIPRSVLAAGLEQFAESTENPFAGVTNVDDLPFAVPDERIAAHIEASDFAAAKLAAAEAHASQIPPDSWLFTLASGFGAQYLGQEYYELAVGAAGPGSGPQGWEDDLFAGIAIPSSPATSSS
jgi:N-acetyl-1-D-myo-inositol-2-amino-2-deoxy-alpha-D-glucopyranoside deacetylase